MTDHPVKRRKKLIEVAIPLEAINAASVREKSIRHGHPSTLHLWWARRPLAAARAVIFCQMVDDPSAVPEEFPTEEDQEKERLRLFALISELVQWENTTSKRVVNRAREEIRRSWRRCCVDNADHPEAAELFNPEKLPGFHDPFAGGGALPLEAQRLGLEAYASDLNPVAVLINKAMIEIPPRFQGLSAVNPVDRGKSELLKREWTGSQGLASDVLYYGELVKEKALEKIGHAYPQIEITEEAASRRPELRKYLGTKLTVMAWIWARTVPTPNPAFSGAEVPLVSTFVLAKKKGKEAYICPKVDGGIYSFEVVSGKPPRELNAENGTKLSRGGNFKCILSGEVMNPHYIRSCGKQGKIGARLLAIVAEGDRERIYLDPDSDQENAASLSPPKWIPDQEYVEDARAFTPSIYGLGKWSDLFTCRQLHALNAFADSIEEVREASFSDALLAGLDNPGIPLSEGGSGALAYSEALTVYMAFALDRLLQQFCTLSVWSNNPAHELVVNAFGRQALSMTWDFGEINPFCESASWAKAHSFLSKAVSVLCNTNVDLKPGVATQSPAQSFDLCHTPIVSTDPPYYDNVPYADLSDFFYVWIRRALRSTFPELLTTLAVPKAEELTAFPYRHGSKEEAQVFFAAGMKSAISRIAQAVHPAFPSTIYYAFKQAESSAANGTVSTGWETFLTGVISSGFSLKGTWPIRTEKPGRMVAQDQNALATSLLLVCEKRPEGSPVISRSEFRRELRRQLPSVIKELETANIAPVDVAQAAIGPGMAIFSNAKAVLNSDDSPMSVREALIEINAALDEYLSEDEGSFDADTRFALTFFESYGYSERPYGDAEGLAVARNISVQGVASAGILSAIAGKVKLLRREQLDDDWDPSCDDRLCIWEATQHLIKALEAGGEAAASALMVQLKQLPGQTDLLANCKAMAYRLYNHCEKTKQAEEARAYNGLVIAWPELERLASSQSTETTVQASLI